MGLNWGFTMIRFSYSQRDMLVAITHTKPTVNEGDMDKLNKFTADFGQEG